MSQNSDVSEKQIDLVAIFKSVWLKRKTVIRWAVIGLIVGLVIAISTPKQYTSKIKVAPESQSKSLGGSAAMLATVIGAGTSTNYDGITEKLYPEIIKSTPFLLEFAPIEVEFNGEAMLLSDYILRHTKRPWWSYVIGFPGQAIGWVMSIGADKVDAPTFANSPATQYAFAVMLGAGINADIDAKQGVITITSTFQDARITKTISDSVMVKLQRYMSDYRTAKTRNTLKTTTQLFDDARERYYEADEQYAQSQDRNQNLISKRAEVALERLKNERNLAYQVYSQLAQQIESLRIKLKEETPVATIIEPATTPFSPSAPSMMMIIVGWAFFGAFAAAITVVIKTLIKK